MAVTIKDIAKIAGVTHSTVSRCLNDKPGVSDAMRAEIKRIAQDLGFEFNANARSLHTSKTETIGIILNEANDDNQPHLFTNNFLRHIRHQLEEEDLDTITTFPHNDYSGKDNIQKIVNRRKVDGLILLTSSIEKETVDFLRDAEIPFVFSHQIPPDEFGKVNAVYCDHRKGGYLATKHLIDCGYRRILCVTRPDQRLEFALRTDGYRQALEEAGIAVDETMILKGGSSFDFCPEDVEREILQVSKYDAIFAHTDLIALEIMKELVKHGISVPKDIALMGYDNIELCTFFEPHLSSVAQPLEDISIKTCEILIKQLAGDNTVKRFVFQPRLIPRETT
ncbi:LacI family DNA-binding transcriptional regulator [Sediminispirochaeta smaragdinae]|uniref:Transcriptional regulator, LacI family n=1 Tax=Sediminispirochaeta smaragdinae (strain DSM 11293 / JCM 15392 / SEBR 4228) TaxID=573413 RepID=E1R6F1_SEDSS|nr:LacI family DNA-binding transcriptional regulator [Sediminispirochaeta smaragdinae]ADK80969.1 transcriptional regulator, LacI family [Sediminispirochaeta smaragdinae DSM 11293]